MAIRVSRAYGTPILGEVGGHRGSVMVVSYRLSIVTVARSVTFRPREATPGAPTPGAPGPRTPGPGILPPGVDVSPP